MTAPTRDAIAAEAIALRAPFPWATVARFWAKVNKTDTCWLWTASTRHKGYGAFAYRLDGRMVNDRAHRFSYQLHVGPIPAGMFVLHSCDVPACVNPAHLFLGTNTDNVRDMMAKGRGNAGKSFPDGQWERGERHHAARLTEADVRTLRARYEAGGTSFSALAREYGLAIGHVYRIVRRKAWCHVE